MDEQNTEPTAAPTKTIGDLVKEAVAEALAQNPADMRNPEADPVIPVPQVDHPPETTDEAAQLGKMFAEYRAEVAALRQELQAHRPRTVTVAGPQETPEQRQEARLAAIAEHSHYCPACGDLSKYPRACRGECGRRVLGSAPIEFVSTDELGGDPAKHTKAPSSDPDRPDPVAV